MTITAVAQPRAPSVVVLLLAGLAAMTTACVYNPGGTEGDDDQPLPTRAVHVATDGSNAAAGTEEAPLQSINVGIAIASSESPPLAVLVRGGIYRETILVTGGVDLYGGLDATWQRNPNSPTTIEAESPALDIEGVTTATRIDGLTVRSFDADGAGASSVAVLVTDSTQITIVDCTILSGSGGAGMDGVDGTGGLTGGGGLAGQPGTERSTASGCTNNPIPVGGLAGASSCGRPGGVGGVPGVGSAAGSSGGLGVGDTLGGTGGLTTLVGGIGQGGAEGGQGSDGTGGMSLGVFSGADYLAADGGLGFPGGGGSGGGGGGGGGGGTQSCDSAGSSGGGGGAGGCPGTAGTGGTGGGGSFGIVAVNSRIVIQSSTVTSSQGGAGGRGGAGGVGGSGGGGGAGGPYGGSSQDDAGNGGAGGPGGRGGDGGAGGGGGGGPSVPLLCAGSSEPVLQATDLVVSQGGAGGVSSGTSGSPGQAVGTLGCL